MIKKAIAISLCLCISIYMFCSCQSNPNSKASTETPLTDNIDGYEEAKFDKFNSYAEENGLAGTKVYIYGEVTKISSIDDAAYAMVKTSDGEWNIIFGYCSTDELKDLYLHKNIYAIGVYTGFSDKLVSPSITLDRVQCDGRTKSYNQLSDLIHITTEETSNNTAAKNSYVLETNQIDYHTLSKDEFAKKVSQDFSTNKISFDVNPFSDLTYFLEVKGTNQLIDANIGFFEFGYEIAITLPTDGDTDECYDILSNGLKSELFGISFDDQVDILAHYKVDEINYEKNGIQPFTITETKSDSFNMLFFRFKH